MCAGDEGVMLANIKAHAQQQAGRNPQQTQAWQDCIQVRHSKTHNPPCQLKLVPNINEHTRTLQGVQPPLLSLGMNAHSHQHFETQVFSPCSLVYDQQSLTGIFTVRVTATM